MERFDRDTLDAFNNSKEIELTTYGRSSGQPHKVTTWIWGDGERVFITSGKGLTRDWPQNLLARPEGIITVAGREVPFRARHVTDASEARQGAALINRKYGSGNTASSGDEPLQPF